MDTRVNRPCLGVPFPSRRVRAIEKYKEELRLPQLPKLPDRDRVAVEAYRRLVRSTEFLRNANMGWLASYDQFMEDVGHPPGEGYTLCKRTGYLRWKKETVYWRKIEC